LALVEFAAAEQTVTALSLNGMKLGDAHAIQVGKWMMQQSVGYTFVPVQQEGHAASWSHSQTIFTGSQQQGAIGLMQQ
jgi:hypothetical protein